MDKKRREIDVPAEMSNRQIKITLCLLYTLRTTHKYTVYGETERERVRNEMVSGIVWRHLFGVISHI